MNKVEAFIRPEKLDNVKDALVSQGILGLSVIQVTGRGVQRGVRTGGRGTQSYMASMLHQSKIEIVVSDADTQKTIDAIVANARRAASAPQIGGRRTVATGASTRSTGSSSRTRGG